MKYFQSEEEKLNYLKGVVAKFHGELEELKCNHILYVSTGINGMGSILGEAEDVLLYIRRLLAQMYDEDREFIINELTNY